MRNAKSQSVAGVDHEQRSTPISDPNKSRFSSSLRQQIEALGQSSLTELRSRYRQVFRQPPVSHLPSWLLVRMIAYRLQERALGGLDKVSERFLDGIVRRLDVHRLKGGRKLDTKAIMALVPAVPRAKGLQPGTQLVREYAGLTHRINVMEAGFEWNGVDYRSLSEIASAITGTNWSGPRFFGLKEQIFKGVQGTTKSKSMATSSEGLS